MSSPTRYINWHADLIFTNRFNPVVKKWRVKCASQFNRRPPSPWKPPFKRTPSKPAMIAIDNEFMGWRRPPTCSNIMYGGSHLIWLNWIHTIYFISRMMDRWWVTRYKAVARVLSGKLIDVLTPRIMFAHFEAGRIVGIGVKTHLLGRDGPIIFILYFCSNTHIAH